MQGMDDENEKRQMNAELTPGVPTIWRLPGSAWIMGALINGIPCYFVGVAGYDITDAFGSFWAASACIAKVLREDWANALRLKRRRQFRLVKANLPEPAPEWWIGNIIAVHTGEIIYQVAVGPTGPFWKLFEPNGSAGDFAYNSAIGLVQGPK